MNNVGKKDFLNRTFWAEYQKNIQYAYTGNSMPFLISYYILSALG